MPKLNYAKRLKLEDVKPLTTSPERKKELERYNRAPYRVLAPKMVPKLTGRDRLMKKLKTIHSTSAGKIVNTWPLVIQ